MARLDRPAINTRLADRIDELAFALVGAPSSRTHDEWRFRNKGSLAVRIAGPKRGAWFDHEAGCGGYPLGLVAHLRQTSIRDAYVWAVEWLGELPDPAQRRAPAAAQEEPRRASNEDADSRRAWSRDLARRLWQEAVPGHDMLRAYLRARGLTLPTYAPLRLHPCAWRNRDYGPHGPAMIALMTEPTIGKPCGVHVTYVRPDGGGKAQGQRPKVMLGSAGVIRLVPDEDITIGLGLAEGIETALAVIQRAGWSPVWAAGSAGPMAKFPLLPGITALTLFADADGAGMEAARICGKRWATAGREARLLAPPAGDWNDALPIIRKVA